MYAFNYEHVAHFATSYLLFIRAHTPTPTSTPIHVHMHVFIWSLGYVVHSCVPNVGVNGVLSDFESPFYLTLTNL